MQKVYFKMPIEELNQLLKQEVKDISLEELYNLSVHFNNETKYLPREYKTNYTESVIKIIVNRFSTLKNNKQTIQKGKLSEKDAQNINQLLDKDTDKIEYILNLIAIYTTYVIKKPIHLPGTVFPGLVTIYSDGKDYYCPVKKHHINNPDAICKICIAKPTD